MSMRAKKQVKRSKNYEKKVQLSEDVEFIDLLNVAIGKSPKKKTAKKKKSKK